MDFKTTTDRLMELGVPARELGEALGLRPNTVRAMRLDPASESHRSAPAGWESALLQLMRGRSKELDALADELGGATTGEAAKDHELAEWRARLEHSYHIEDWLEDSLSPEGQQYLVPPDDVRAVRRSRGPLTWVVRYYKQGRSLIFGVEEDAVLYAGADQIIRAAERGDWLARLDDGPVLIRLAVDGCLEVSEWADPDVAEVWFPDPRRGFCVAFIRDVGHGPFLALQSRGFRAIGDKHPSDPRTYSTDELTAMLARHLPSDRWGRAR